MAVERRSSLVGQRLEHLVVCHGQGIDSQDASHPPRRSSTRCSIPSHANHLGRPIGPATPSLKLFSLQWPKKQQWTRHAHTNLHNLWGFRHLINAGATCCRRGRQVSGKGGQVSSKCRRRAVHRPSQDWKPGGVGAKGWAVFWRASDGKWRFPKAQLILAGQTRSHVPVVLVALLHLFFFEEGTRCLLVAQMQVPFLPRACHLLPSEENSARLQKSISVCFVGLQQTSISRLPLKFIKRHPEPSRSTR